MAFLKRARCCETLSRERNISNSDDDKKIEIYNAQEKPPVFKLCFEVRHFPCCSACGKPIKPGQPILHWHTEEIKTYVDDETGNEYPFVFALHVQFFCKECHSKECQVIDKMPEYKHREKELEKQEPN